MSRTRDQARREFMAIAIDAGYPSTYVEDLLEDCVRALTKTEMNRRWRENNPTKRDENHSHQRDENHFRDKNIPRNKNVIHFNGQKSEKHPTGSFENDSKERVVREVREERLDSRTSPPSAPKFSGGSRTSQRPATIVPAPKTKLDTVPTKPIPVSSDGRVRVGYDHYGNFTERRFSMSNEEIEALEEKYPTLNVRGMIWRYATEIYKTVEAPRVKGMIIEKMAVTWADRQKKLNAEAEKKNYTKEGLQKRQETFASAPSIQANRERDERRIAQEQWAASRKAEREASRGAQPAG